MYVGKTGADDQSDSDGGQDGRRQIKGEVGAHGAQDSFVDSHQIVSSGMRL